MILIQPLVAFHAVSYLEIYNEQIRDLLIPNSPANLNLRESDGRVVVPGLSEQTPASAQEVVSMIIAANANRAVSATEANAVSSRSHAVLCVNVKQKSRTAAMSEDYTMATLSIIDLAGSERASVTKNSGSRLLEGANINKSLLALGSCINALCDPKKSVHVPYRNSKLTRLLRHSLGGNCRTLMIVCVSPASHHYDESFNTLQYANRAKEIKTKVTRNVISVDRHVSQYVKVIYELRQEIAALKGNSATMEEKWRQNSRQLRDKSRAEVQDIIKSLRKSFEDVKGNLASIGSLKAEQELIRQLLTAILHWKSSALPSNQTIDPTYTYDVDNLASSYAARLQIINSEITQCENAKNMFEAVCSSSIRKVSNPLGAIATEFPELLQLVNYEINNIKLETSIATMQARDTEAARHGNKTTSLLKVLQDVQDKNATDISICSSDQSDKIALLEEIQERISKATQEATSSLLSSGIVPAAATRQGALHLNASTSAQSKKRTATMRSPNPDSSAPVAAFSRPGKVQRSSLAASTSTVAAPKKRSSLTAPTQASQARSSLKPTTLSRKSSNVSLSISSSKASTSISKPAKEEKKGVMWKDSYGDKLTEEHSKSIIDYSDTSGDASNSSLAGPSSRGSAQSAVRRPLRSIPPLRKTTLNTEIIAEEDESSTSFSSSVDGVAAHLVNDSISSAAGDDESFQNDTTSMPLQAGPLGFANMARISAATRPLGTPPKKAPGMRRASAIGPIRSAKKKSRVSFIGVGNTSAASSNADSVDDSKDAGAEPRRAGRTTLSLQNRLAAQAAEASRRESVARAGALPLSGVNARVAAARARRESMTASSLGSSKPFDMSLDLNTSSRPTLWG